MFTLHPPSDLARTAFRMKQARLGFSYAPIGCTRSEVCPKGYVADHTRVGLGTGRDDFDAARESLRAWKQFPNGWTSIDPSIAPISEGTVVTMVAMTFGLFTMNACRIVYTIDEPNRFGFAYGTLPGHVESGEERFLIEMKEDGKVWYELLAYSRPRHWLARLGYPLARIAQARFRRESCEAMVNAVRNVPVLL